MPGSRDGLQQKVGLSRALWHLKLFYSSPGAFPSWHLVSVTAQGRDSVVQFHGMFSWAMLALPWVNMPRLRLSFSGPLASDYLQRFRVPIAQSSCLRISFEEEGSRLANCPVLPQDRAMLRADELQQSPVHQQSCHQESM